MEITYKRNMRLFIIFIPFRLVSRIHEVILQFNKRENFLPTYHVCIQQSIYSSVVISGK